MPQDNEWTASTPSGQPIQPAPAPVAAQASAQGQPAPAASNDEWTASNPSGQPVSNVATGNTMSAGPSGFEERAKAALTGDKNTPTWEVPAKSAEEVAKGVGKGVLSTTAGIGSTIKSGLNLVNSDLAEKWLPSSG